MATTVPLGLHYTDYSIRQPQKEKEQSAKRQKGKKKGAHLDRGMDSTGGRQLDHFHRPLKRPPLHAGINMGWVGKGNKKDAENVVDTDLIS